MRQLATWSRSACASNRCAGPVMRTKTRASIRDAVNLLLLKLTLLSALCGSPETALAQSSLSPDSAASRHYAAALQALAAKRYSDAVDHFEAADALSPRSVVKYNLGQAYAAAGRALEARRTLLEYLASGDPDLTPERERFLNDLIRAQERKLASIQVMGATDGARLLVDGALTQQPREVWVVPGHHALAISGEQNTHRYDVDLEEGERFTLHLDKRVTEVVSGLLIPTCNIPGVALFVDGVSVGETPVDPTILRAGVHSLVWKRKGYYPHSSTVQIGNDAPVEVRCSLRSTRDPQFSSTLRIDDVAEGTRVFVNGSPHRPGQSLVPGPNWVKVTQPGHVPWERRLNFRVGETKHVVPELNLDPAFRERLDRQAGTQRRWAYVVGGAGVGALAGAGVLYLDNDTRHDRWMKNQRKLDDRWLGVTPSTQVRLELDQDANDRLGRQIAIRDRLTVGLATFGASAVVAGGLLFFFGDDVPAVHAEVSQKLSQVRWSEVW